MCEAGLLLDWEPGRVSAGVDGAWQGQWLAPAEVAVALDRPLSWPSIW